MHTTVLSWYDWKQQNEIQMKSRGTETKTKETSFTVWGVLLSEFINKCCWEPVKVGMNCLVSHLITWHCV